MSYCIDGIPVKGPVDYAEAILKMVENTNLQEACNHPYDDIIQVFNVPPQLSITRDTTDWLCSICGEIVPPF